MPRENHRPRAAHSAPARLTPVEFEIMEIIWSQGSALVRDVHRELYRRKGLAYTTVMTEMMQMYRKGILAHSKQGRAYLYAPRLSRREALEATLKDFVGDFFHGSVEELALFISGNDGLPRPGPPRTVTPAAGLRSEPDREAAAIEEEDVTLL